MGSEKPSLTLDELSDMLGRDRIRFPKPITATVWRVTVCPVCRWPHPSDVACKPGEARDNGPTFTRRDDL